MIAGMYRYGDGTQFPLDENFIETLTAAVEACAGAYTPIADLDERKERAREGKRQADKELARLAELSDSMEEAGNRFGPNTGRTATPVQQVAAKAIAAVKQAVDTAKAQISTRVTELDTEAKGSGLGQQIRTHLAPFFNKHALPSSSWAAAWDARGSHATGTAVATAGKIAATFDLQLAGQWTQGVRIDLLAPGLSLLLPKRKAFGAGAKPSVVHLDKHALVAFERGGGHTTLIIREKAVGPAPGYRFSEENGNWVAVAIDQNNDVQGQELALGSDDAAGLRTLAEATNKTIEAFKANRSLRELRVANQSLDAHPQPRAVVDAVLVALTPLARTLKEKSKVTGELVLKRDLSGGKREEIFVSRAELAAKFSALPAEYKKLFEDMGLARDSTQPGAPNPDRITTMSDIPTVVTEPPIAPPPERSHSPTDRHTAPPPERPHSPTDRHGSIAPTMPAAPVLPSDRAHGTISVPERTHGTTNPPPIGAAPRPPGSGTIPPPPPGAPGKIGS
jgi:hypothetical protein